MRTKTNLFASGLPVIIAATILVSCHKNDELKSGSQQVSASGNDKAATKLVNLRNLATADEGAQLAFALDPTLAVSSAVTACTPIITYDNPPGVYPRTVTTDWGTGCTSADGIARSGKVLRTYFGDMADTTVNSYYIEYYDNYYAKYPNIGWDSVKFEGSLKMRHEARPEDPQFRYRSVSRNRKLTEINGDYVIYNGITKINKREDDGLYPGTKRLGWFMTKGVQTGDVLSGGVAYQFRDSIDSDNPLINKYCQYTVKGNRLIDFTNQPSWFVNYGTTLDCDDQAELTISGITTTITLPIDLW